MKRIGLLLTCLGLLVCFAAAQEEAVERLLKKHELSRFQVYQKSRPGKLRFSQTWRVNKGFNVGITLNQALVYAAYNGDLTEVKEFLSFGADPNYFMYITDGEITPIVAAAVQDHAEIIVVLIAAGADPDLIVDEVYPVEYALYNQFYDAAEALLSGGADPDVAMIGMTIANDATGLELLIYNGGDVNLSDANFSVIFYGAYLGNEACLKVLVSNGAWIDYSGPIDIPPVNAVCLCTVADDPPDSCNFANCDADGRARMQALLS